MDRRISEKEFKRIEARWKSDVDLKLDRMLSFAKLYEPYLELLIEREKTRAALRKAVIEKSLSGLVYSGLIVLGTALWQYIKEHVK